MRRPEILLPIRVETLWNIFLKPPLIIGMWLFLLLRCTSSEGTANANENPLFTSVSKTSLVVLGTAQDAGKPHIGCTRKCCASKDKEEVVSLGVVVPKEGKKYLFEATPDIGMQMKWLSQSLGGVHSFLPDGIFLTHAHMGHYAGLMYLGKEAFHSQKVAVYAMPKMKTYLENNGPWSQLVTEANIEILPLANERLIVPSPQLKITPLLMPHRDEYSETVGFIIEGPHKKALFIPDIDKWEKWDRNIVALIAKVDYAFLDGTFYDGKELNHRDMSEIPHPFIVESLETFKNLPPAERNKVFFIHLNHTNPLLDPKSAASQRVLNAGFYVARKGMVFEL